MLKFRGEVTNFTKNAKCLYRAFGLASKKTLQGKCNCAGVILPDQTQVVFVEVADRLT